MQPILSRIKIKCNILPPKDIKYAEKFIKERNFEALLEIVDSDIKIHNRKKNADGLFDNEEDAELDEKYCDLYGDILTYIKLVDPDFSFDDDFFEEDYL